MWQWVRNAARGSGGGRGQIKSGRCVFARRGSGSQHPGCILGSVSSREASCAESGVEMLVPVRGRFGEMFSFVRDAVFFRETQDSFTMSR